MKPDGSLFGPHGQNFVHDAAGHLGLVHLGLGLGALFGDEGDHIGARAEARALHLHVVAHHQIQVLGLQLFAGVLLQVLGLHGKAAQKGR